MNDGRVSVPSGSFVVCDGQDEIIEAHLGTCVAVALFDPEAHVGGMLHLLLPEPTGTEGGRAPEKYATTGLPLFIKAMMEKGAETNRMEASIAGGALIGPLSQRDLQLDIGGRTAETVERILSQEGISTTKTETGGFFTCRLVLNLRTGESTVEQFESHPLSTMATPLETIAPSQIDLALEQIRPIPQIALKIIRMIRDQNYSFADMAVEIRQDQVISAKVMRLCNSALFSGKTEVDSIDRALILLGEKRFLQLVVSASVEDFLSQTGQGYSLCKGGLFRHALGTGILCETLANLTGKVPLDVAYTAGLLHDIGKVVLDQYIQKASSLFYRKTQFDGISLITVENEQFGIAHTETGGQLAERWSLSDNLIDAIRHHHCPEDAEGHDDLCHLVYLADLLMSRYIVGQELERLDTEALSGRLQHIGVGPEQFPKIIDSMPGQLFHAAAIGKGG
jgi:putative nucleotidyltransferase with HDIG domain